MLLSVIIPNYNGAPFIESLCRSLAAQTLLIKEYEIIFVDNGSTDESLSLIKGHCSSLPNLRIISYTEKQSSYAARNYGVSHSQGEVLVFTDVDCRPQDDWLACISETVKKQSGSFLITGPVNLFPAGESFNYYEWYDYCTSLDQEAYSRSQFGATANLVVSRNAFERVKGFAPIISGGDYDFCRRIMMLSDVEFIYQPKAFVLHPARSTADEIKKKAYRVGQGNAELNYHSRASSYRFTYLLKNFVGLIIQPNQLKIIIYTSKHKKLVWTLCFFFVAFKMGFYARKSLLLNYLRLIFKKN